MDSELEKSPIWAVLVETVHSLSLYRSHKAYTQELILPEKPGITPEELSKRLGMPLGEALVILAELSTEKLEKSGG